MSATVLTVGFLAAVALAVGSFMVSGRSPTTQPHNASTLGSMPTTHPSLERATFGAGCFWGVEAEFRRVEGVIATRVGYTGGHVANPTYKQVCNGDTGHAEAVEVVFDPSKVSYEALLEVFWANHDPTQVNRQGPDFGEQYRTVIFYHSPEQKRAAEASKEALAKSGRYRRPIATQIVEASTFWEAEEYHQQYLEKRGLGSCHTR